MTCNRCNGTGYLIGIAAGGRTASAESCGCKSSCARCGGIGALWSRSDQPGVWYSLHQWVMDGHEYDLPLGHSSGVKDCECQVGEIDVSRNAALFNAAGIPRRHRNATFDNYDPQEPYVMEQGLALRSVRSAVVTLTMDDVGDQGQLIHGALGTGKTHLAVAAIRDLTLRHGIGAVFVDFGLLLAELKRGFGTKLSGSVLERMEDATVLVIDEAGRHLERQYGREVMEQLITARYNASRTIWLTSNYDRAQLADESRMGARLSSRLAEVCGGSVAVPGDDYRRRGQAGQRSMV